MLEQDIESAITTVRQNNTSYSPDGGAIVYALLLIARAILQVAAAIRLHR